MFVCHYEYKRIQSRRNCSFTKTISMGQHQCPKCERQFARSDSLRRHLTVVSALKIWSQKQCQKMSEESDAETSRSHQKEDIFGKYTDKDCGIRDGSDTDYTDEVMKTNIILEKRASLILGKFLLVEPIDT